MAGRAFLDFPVNETTIYPNYRQNPDELKRIRRTIDSALFDKTIQVQRIYLHGYASPESPFSNNTRLAKGRTAALKEYMESKKRLDQLNKTLNTLGKIDVSLLPKDKVDKINALVRSQFPLAGAVERGEKQLKELDAELQKMKKGKVKVRDTMYPGTKLSINSILKNVQVEEKHCVQYVEEDFVRTGPY